MRREDPSSGGLLLTGPLIFYPWQNWVLEGPQNQHVQGKGLMWAQSDSIALPPAGCSACCRFWARYVIIEHVGQPIPSCYDLLAAYLPPATLHARSIEEMILMQLFKSSTRRVL